MQAWGADSRATASTHTVAVHGPHMRPRGLGHDGGMEGVEVTLTPWAAHRLFGTPMADLTDTVVGADEVLGRRVRILAEQLSEGPDWTARCGILNRTLLRWTAQAPASHQPDDGVLRAWHLLNRSSGTMTVQSLAQRIQWSTRHLEARFRRQIGLSPKGMARVIRVNRAIRQLASGSSPASSALTCGYYDQAHLIREFKALTGTTPGRFQAGLAPASPPSHPAERPTRPAHGACLGPYERHVIPHADFR
ncbi:helix-turn-helix domain-containing protein [Streptomyces sp. NPDC001389]|uniref:helix-turn-helix domain-containing protein n=1 Tax=unclassified Streptomyces TaxID=2593676 RepID=UPI0036C4D96F